MSSPFISLYFYYFASLTGLKLSNYLVQFLTFRVANCCIANQIFKFLFTSSFEADKYTCEFAQHTGKEF